jgi:hypothetical protein
MMYVCTRRLAFTLLGRQFAGSTTASGTTSKNKVLEFVDEANERPATTCNVTNTSNLKIVIPVDFVETRQLSRRQTQQFILVTTEIVRQI